MPSPSSGSGSELRQRAKKQSKEKVSNVDTNGNHAKHDSSGVNGPSDVHNVLNAVWMCVWSLMGLIVMFIVSWLYYWYMRTLHENQLWFSNIGQLEREISLRTECGLYYSYYKQILEAPTFERGLYDLTVDNVTEHGHSINILQRFNVYQEVVLAGLYKRVAPALDPMLFYVYSIFQLAGFYVCAVFACTWYISGSWLGGLLSAVWMLVGMDDATRVFFTVNLRESFALPFLAAQMYCISVYLERTGRRSVCFTHSMGLCITTLSFAFAICWQFNQFVFLLQCISLFVLGTVRLAPLNKCIHLMCCLLSALMLVWVCQFCQPMLLGSLVVSFVPCAILVLVLCREATISGGIVSGFLKLVLQGVLVLLLTLCLHLTLKHSLQLDADDHIYKFVRGKLMGQVALDFEARIYICHGAFLFLENAFFWRTSMTGVFPFYMLLVSSVLFLLCRDLILEWCAIAINHPETVSEQPVHVPLDPSDPTDMAYFCCQRPNLMWLVFFSCLSGFVAMLTLRMKYLWYPQMAILAGVCASDKQIWTELVDSVLGQCALSRRVSRTIRHALPLLIVAVVLGSFYPKHQEYMADLKEFWDPDTVELMEWIDKHTAKGASFAGSMQLLAGVKACTQRHLINHPHFEDKWLRDRTKRVYQMYGRRSARDVHDLLVAEDTHYIILEDSICLAPSDGCRTPDLIDFDNGIIPDSGYQANGLYKTEMPRFCDQIRHNQSEYTRLFTLRMSNPTFRLYEVVTD